MTANSAVHPTALALWAWLAGWGALHGNACNAPVQFDVVPSNVNSGGGTGASGTLTDTGVGGATASSTGGASGAGGAGGGIGNAGVGGTSAADTGPGLGCTSDNDCPGRRCNVPSGDCVDCVEDTDCTAIVGAPHCAARKVCVQCLSLLDCKDAEEHICSPAGRCVDDNGNENPSADGSAGRGDADRN